MWSKITIIFINTALTCIQIIRLHITSKTTQFQQYSAISDSNQSPVQQIRNLNSSASVNQLPILGQTQVFTQKINMGQIQQPIRYRLIHNPLDGIVVDQSWISLDPRGGF